MSYTPVSQRNIQKKTGYTPVRQRTNVDVRNLLGVNKLIGDATAFGLQKEREKTGIQRLSERDMSQDTIRQGTEQISPLRRLARSIPVIGKSFERNVIDPIAKVGRFIAPDFQQSMREALEEDPTRSFEELRERAKELQAQGFSFGADIDKTGIDPTGAIGSIAKAPQKLLQRIISARSAEQAAEVVSEIGLRGKVSQELTERIIKAGDERVAQQVFEELSGQKTPSYTPVRERQVDSNVATEGKSFFDKKIDREIKEKKTVIIDSDDLKIARGDLDPADNIPYAQATQEAYREALQKNPNPNVYLTVGGPGTGKTEILGQFLADDGGTMLQGTGGNVSRVIERYNEAVKVGKTPTIISNLVDPEDAWRFAKAREEFGKQVTDFDYFVKRHKEAMESLQKLISDGYNVAIIDSRGNKLDATKKVFVRNPEEQLDLIKSLDYTKQYENIARSLGKPVQQSKRTAGLSKGSDELPAGNRQPQSTARNQDRVKIDTELGAVEEAIKNRSITLSEIDELELRVNFAEEALQQNQASSLIKYLSRSTGRLPEVTGGDTLKSLTGSGKSIKNSEFGRRGDDIVTELGFEDVDEAQRAVEEYVSQRDRIRELRDVMSSKKASRALVNKVDKITKAASKGRKNFVNAIRDHLGLSNDDIQKLSNRRDYRMMSDAEFDTFIQRLEQKAVELADTRQAKIELVDLLERRHFQKVDNYRKTQGFPPVREMTSAQLRQYADALEQFQTGDEFLTERQLEVVDRSNLTGIKTMREARERLLEQVRKMPGMESTTLEDLQNIKVSALDNLRFDTALAEKNPYYNFIVNRTQTHMLVGETNYLQVQNKINELAQASNKSRERGVLGSVRQAIIPKHQEIVDYLEAPMTDKSAFSEKLTKEELDYANYIQQYYSEAYDHLVRIKELYGSRYVDQYFTHIRRNFLEAWSDDGFVKAMREWFTSQKEDMAIANIIDQDTGQILPKSKFFQYTLQRTGDLEPSKNVTRVFLQYAKAFERKRMFDEMIPEVDIYTQSLTPQNLTPKGLEMDRSLKTFIKKYLNNKKGRRENFGGIIKQSGPADILVRMGNTMVSLIDLGLSLGPSVASSVGEQVMTYQALGKINYTKAWKRRLWDTGIKRMTDKNANKILKEAEPFIGRNIWTELAEPDQGIMDRGMKTIFGAFSQSTVEANKLFLLGRITKEELASGKLSSERLAQLRLEAGRWRDLGKDVKSIVGSTSVGEMTTKYKGWAIPIARTNIQNVTALARGLKQGKFKETLTSREAAETYRAIEMSTALVLVGSYILSEEDDQTFVGKLKARAYMESMTLMGGIDPTLFMATPRLYSFLQKLAENLKQIVTLEQYQQDSQWGEKGDLKGVKGVQRQFTPAAIRQFNTGESTSASTSGASNIDFGFGDLSGNGDMGEVDFGFSELDFEFTN